MSPERRIGLTFFCAIALAVFEAWASAPSAPVANYTSLPDVEGFKLGTSARDAFALCESRSNNHTQIYSMVDADGHELRTMPISGAQPSDENLLRRVGNARLPLAVGPYVSVMFCNSKAGSIEIHFSRPAPESKVNSVLDQTATATAQPLNDFVNTLVGKYGPPADQIGPFPLDPGDRSPQPMVKSLKWLFPKGGTDCAPQVQGHGEMEFTPLLTATGRCATHLLVRVVARPEGLLIRYTLQNLSETVTQIDAQAADLHKANPSIPLAPSVKAGLTASLDNGCRALALVGCTEATPSLICRASLERANRIRHINTAGQPAEDVMLQCLMKAGSVERVAACGVSCTPGPKATHEAVGAANFTSSTAMVMYGRACMRMKQLGCNSNPPGICENDLASNNQGRVSAACVEAAQVASDVILCGASCASAQAAVELLSESYDKACEKLKDWKCRIGKSDTCSSDLHGLAMLLRTKVPSPRECIERALIPLETTLCGVPCP